MKLANGNEIVLVDDDDVDSHFVELCLKESSLQNAFLYFNSGEKFLVYMKSVSQGEASMPAIVLLDINMPRIGGFEILEQLRTQSEFKDLPVVTLYSNSDNPKEMARAMSLNAGFVEKFSSRIQAINFLESLV